MLGSDNKVDCFLGVRLQLLVARHGIGLAERDGCDSLRVHRPLLQVASVTRLDHSPGQIIQTLFDDFFVFALLVCVARSEKR